jgi:hypothetical protein
MAVYAVKQGAVKNSLNGRTGTVNVHVELSFLWSPWNVPSMSQNRILNFGGTDALLPGTESASPRDLSSSASMV